MSLFHKNPLADTVNDYAVITDETDELDPVDCHKERAETTTNRMMDDDYMWNDQDAILHYLPSAESSSINPPPLKHSRNLISESLNNVNGPHTGSPHSDKRARPPPTQRKRPKKPRKRDAENNEEQGPCAEMSEDELAQRLKDILTNDVNLYMKILQYEVSVIVHPLSVSV